MIRHQLFIAAALLAGVAIGYFLKPDTSEVAAEKEKGYVPAAKIADRGEAASVRALRARIADLEAMLAEAKTERPVSQPVASATEVKPAPERRGPPSMADMRARMEKLKKEDPKKFAEITSRMAKFRQRRLERANAKLDFLSAVDTSAMTDEQRKSHEAYQDLIARREEIEEQLHGEDISDEDREAAFRKMRETDEALRRAARQERETLIDQTARALGFSGDDATAVGETLRNVISSTESGHGMPPPPPGSQHP